MAPWQRGAHQPILQQLAVQHTSVCSRKARGCCSVSGRERKGRAEPCTVPSCPSWRLRQGQHEPVGVPGQKPRFGSTPRKVNETHLKRNGFILYCMLSDLPVLLLTAGVYPRYKLTERRVAAFRCSWLVEPWTKRCRICHVRVGRISPGFRVWLLFRTA